MKINSQYDIQCRIPFKLHPVVLLPDYRNYNMIIEKLMVEEFAAERTIKEEYTKLKAIRSISELLKQIDFTVEVVPLKDPNRLKRLMVSLKGEPLNSEEIKVIQTIVA